MTRLDNNQKNMLDELDSLVDELDSLLDELDILRHRHCFLLFFPGVRLQEITVLENYV